VKRAGFAGEEQPFLERLGEQRAQMRLAGERAGIAARDVRIAAPGGRSEGAQMLAQRGAEGVGQGIEPRGAGADDDEIEVGSLQDVGLPRRHGPSLAPQGLMPT
jgi:hypothetical protein